MRRVILDNEDKKYIQKQFLIYSLGIVNGIQLFDDLGRPAKSAGLEHIIVEYGDEFIQKGIPKEEIAQTLMKAVKENNIVERTKIGNVYKTMINGKPIYINIGIGSNGFISRANMVSSKKY